MIDCLVIKKVQYEDSKEGIGKNKEKDKSKIFLLKRLNLGIKIMSVLSLSLFLSTEHPTKKNMGKDDNIS